MGSHIKNFLVEQEEYDIYITTRKPYKSSDHIVYLQGDAKDINFMAKLCEEQWDSIVDFMVYSTQEMSERIEMLLGATKQYVFISSARVYAESTDNLVETSPRLLETSKDELYLASDEYAISKARQENILFNSKANNWTIVRPSLTYSENRLQLGAFEKENLLYRACMIGQ